MDQKDQNQAPPQTKRKRKKVKKKKGDQSRPKFPLTGYTRFTNERRDILKLERPSLGHIEITKLLAEQWLNLSDEVKKPYLDAANEDKMRFNREMLEYNKAKGEGNGGGAKERRVETVDHAQTNGRPKTLKEGEKEIPIFTEEFLEHNKIVETELKALRKSHTDYEQQNSVLEQHVENMKNGVQKLEDEEADLKARNVALEKYLNKLKSSLVQALAALPITGHPNGANMGNVEKYMLDLQSSAKSGTVGSVNKARDIIRKMDLNSLS